MGQEIEIQIPWLRYDVTLPLIQGRVKIEGVRLVPSGAAPGGTVLAPDSPLRRGDFGLIDLNMANWLPAMEAGWDLIGLPVFPKRKHLYTYLFCRADAGIETPKDLEGRRVLGAITSSAVATWLRALLEGCHGVDLDSITWVSPREQWPVHGTRWKVEAFAPKKDIVDVLLDGDADATLLDISDRRLFERLENDSRFRRVLPDYLGAARRVTLPGGGYLPVHMLAMSRRLDRAHPELAGKLVDAFIEARQLAYDDILDDRSGYGVIDLRERFMAQMRDWGDPFPYGLKANRATLDAFTARSFEYGTIARAPEYREVFAASTLES